MPREDDREIALRSLVKSLSSWFAGLDLVPSDIFAALLLLNLWSTVSDASCLDDIYGQFERTASSARKDENNKPVDPTTLLDHHEDVDNGSKVEEGESEDSLSSQAGAETDHEGITGGESVDGEVEEHHSANAGDISLHSFDSPGFLSALMTATVSSIALGSNSSAGDSQSQGSNEPSATVSAPDMLRSPAELPEAIQPSTREPPSSQSEDVDDGRHETAIEILRRAELYIPYAIACYGMMLQVWRCCSNCCDGFCWILQNILCCTCLSRSSGDGWLDKKALEREAQERDYHIILEAPADAFSPAFFLVADLSVSRVLYPV